MIIIWKLNYLFLRDIKHSQFKLVIKLDSQPIFNYILISTREV